MKGTFHWCLRVCLALLPLAVGFVAVLHLIDGVALERAFPVPVYIQMDAPLARKTYENAADALARGDRRDGERTIFEAEALSNAGESHERIFPLVRSGLAYSPTTARGWLLLSEF